MMAGVSYSIQYDDRQVQSYLKRAIRATENLRPAMTAIGELIIDKTQQRFTREQAPDGTPWAPLSPKTIKYKKRSKNKILILSSNLKNKYYKRATRNTVTVSTDGITIAYAATHQFGDDKRNIPARPYLGIAQKDFPTIRQILLKATKL